MKLILPHITLAIVLLIGMREVNAQTYTVTISGPTTANVGDTQNFSAVWRNASNQIVSPPSGGSFWWTVSTSGAEVISQSSTSLSVKWITTGSRIIDYEYAASGNGWSDLHTVTVSGSVPAAPSTTFTITQNCGSTVVTANSSPPAGVEWYWQTISGGSTALGANASITRTSAGNLFLRARYTAAPNGWSVASTSTGGVTIVSPPAVPTSATNGEAIAGPGSVVNLSVSTVAGATSYQWFTQSVNGTAIPGATSNTYSPPATASQAYHVQSMIGACPSTQRREVVATIYPEPVIIASNNSRIVMGVPVQLSLSYTYASYQWKKNGVAIVGATNPTYEAKEAASYSVAVTKGLAAEITSAAKTVTLGIDGQNVNYVANHIIKRAGVTISDIDTLSAKSNTLMVEYTDGLGRPMQSVITQGSPTKKDIVQPIAYDALGKESVKYLPYAAIDGSSWFKSNFLPKENSNYATSPQYQFYQSVAGIVADTRPYTEITYEASPLNRPINNYGPGEAWAAKPVEQKYLTNVHNTGTSLTDEKVIAWKVVNDLPVRRTAVTGFIESGGYYSSAQLTVSVTVDEHGNAVREFKNKEGQVVLNKVQAKPSTDLNHTAQWALTYYVYDDLGNLRFVFQPEMSKILHGSDTAVANTIRRTNWAFQYAYDSHNRMVTKRVPGGGVVYLVYDNRNRLVATQDANQRSTANRYWTFIKYDALNRPILTGIKDTSALLTQAQMQAAVDAHYAKPWTKPYETFIGTATGNVHGYSSNKSYPVFTGPTTTNDANRYLSVTYYDTYAFRATFADNSNYDFKSNDLDGQDGVHSERVIGQITGTKVKVLDGGITGGSSWLKTVNYYDEEYRIIQLVSDNFKQGRDRVTSIYDFTDKVRKTKSSHDQSDIQWKDITSGVVRVGERLYRHAGGSDNNQGAASAAMLPANTDGWFEFTHSNANDLYIGLSAANTNTAFTSIDYCVRVGGSVFTPIQPTYSNGTSAGNALGDVFRIERVSGTVRLRKNGTVVHTYQGTSTSALLVDVSFYSGQSSVLFARASFTTSSHSVIRRFEYDHADRLINTWHKLDSEPEILLSRNVYNELGQLVDKKLHSTNEGETFKQSVDHTYNIRGWLSGINNAGLTQTDADSNRDLFGMELLYNTIDSDISNTALYNGNISAVKWSNRQGVVDVKQHAYRYSYDEMNRLLASTFNEKTTGWTALADSRNAESGFEYDLNGNITKLKRNDKRTSGLKMDDLIYEYGSENAQSNRLLKVIDNGDDFNGFVDGANAGNDYNYDANGNMTLDLNKGISTAITYNMLNLPEVVTRGAGNTVRYIYDANGRKLSQVVSYATVQKQTDYAGEYQYEDDVLQQIAHEEGRIVVTNTETVYTHNADVTTGMTANVATLAAITQNGSTYVRAVANGTTSKQGIFPIGGTFDVEAGEVYRIRVKGYRSVTSNAVYLNIRVNGADINWPGTQLAPSPDTEAWVEQTVTIPADGESLQIGVIWNTTANSQVFFLNDFEITKIGTNAPEYQYNLKDHLGNVRVTFTSKHEADLATATMETANVSNEQGEFIYYDEAVKINSTLFDHTNAGGTNYATRLTGMPNHRFGLAKSLRVMLGDTVRATVHAKYLDTNSGNWTTALNNLMTAIANGTAPGGTLVDGGLTGSTGGVTPPHAGVISKGSETGTAPKAYLNFLVFNNDMTTVLDAGFVRLTEAGREYGQDGVHEELFKELVITEPGYVYLYLSNDNYALGGPMIEVYFDDFMVEHVKSPVIQQDDFYAFGLNFNSYQRENSIENQYLYNGKEKQDELDLGWLDYGARMYMPELGRWGALDPLSDNSISMTPYHYAANNPIIFIDIDGMDWFYYKNENESEATWNWHEGSEYTHTYTYTDDNGEEVTSSITLSGAEAVVVFEGFTKEELGQVPGHAPGTTSKSNQYLGQEGIGGIYATVTVYGPDGANDIATYRGYTNSSDPNAFGVVADGIHNGKFAVPGKSGSLESNFYVKGEDGQVPARFGKNPAFPSRDPGYLDGVYIHSVNSNGWAGTYMKNGVYSGVSQGCLLIDRTQWESFKEQLSGIQNFKVQIKRTIHPQTFRDLFNKMFPKPRKK